MITRTLKQAKYFRIISVGGVERGQCLLNAIPKENEEEMD